MDENGPPNTMPAGEIWQRTVSLLQEYKRARSDLIAGEALVDSFIWPAANEIRNGWDDLAKVLGRWTSEDNYESKLVEAKRHFQRCRSEVYEYVLLTRLSALRTILDSLKKDPDYRVARAKHHSALSEAFDRGCVANRRAREMKDSSPDRAILEAKTGISLVQMAVDAFMEHAGDFELADRVVGIKRDVRLSTMIQILVAVALFAAGILFSWHLR
ncbi:MAG: hypothetical protein IH991_08210 [Planctomycetes bacterium]|nr:hypothetical protein [Planctomycetota bacterium]